MLFIVFFFSIIQELLNPSKLNSEDNDGDMEIMDSRFLKIDSYTWSGIDTEYRRHENLTIGVAGILYPL